MPNLIDVTYAQTGESTFSNAMGMRAMQARAYEARNSQYLLIKAPPASGKSRALMFVALDKLHNQGLNKVIVAVPERSIGGSFGPEPLSKFGFFTDWSIAERNNLCTTDDTMGTVKSFQRFMAGDDDILVCTHATLRYAFEKLDTQAFDNTLLAIDEFHHVSADGENVLGELLRNVMEQSTAHVVAMTGSYFRGDSVPVLAAHEEAKFDKVTFNYYEQLNGYTYLKSLGIGYHFYQGRYITAINEVLDTDKKTIIHIPSVNAAESTKEKHDEVQAIIDSMGKFQRKDEDTGIIYVKRKDGKVLKVADLVWDVAQDREKIVTTLRNINSLDDMDIIIALGMAKEGFDWEYCEHALTVGYRGSLTEIIQIIGRCTRDSSNKTHAQFTNLIAQPDAEDEVVTGAVNNMLKAITCSLLMEQVLAPNFKFKRKLSDDEKPTPGEIKIRGFKEPTTQRVKDIVESDLNDLTAAVLQDDKIVKTLPGGVEPEIINKKLIPKLIKLKYPDLNDEEVDQVRHSLLANAAFKNNPMKEEGDKRFLKMAGKFVNIEELSIDLIDSVNPFQSAFEVISKTVNTDMLKKIQETIQASRINMSEDEAKLLWPKIKAFVKEHGKHPDMNSTDLEEVRMAEAVLYLKDQRRKMGV